MVRKLSDICGGRGASGRGCCPRRTCSAWCGSRGSGSSVRTRWCWRSTRSRGFRPCATSTRTAGWCRARTTRRGRCRCRDAVLHGERRQELTNLGLSHVLWVTAIVESDEPSNPVDVRLLRAPAVPTLAKPAAHDLNEPEPMLGLRRSRKMGLGNNRERHAVACTPLPSLPPPFQRQRCDPTSRPAFSPR
jgi:hypothetical protein